MSVPYSANRFVADTRQMAFSGQRPPTATVDDLCAKPDQLVGEIRFYPAISDGRSRQGRRDRPRGNRYVLNFLYSQRRPSWRRQTCPRTSRPVIVRLGMMTVHKCQALVIAGRWINPRVRRMAIIVPSYGLNRPASGTGRTERPDATRRLSRWQPQW